MKPMFRLLTDEQQEEIAAAAFEMLERIGVKLTEPELLGEFQERILPQIVEYEQQARKMLVDHNSNLLDDRVFRALGILRAARLLGAEEAMKLLSRIRLGVHLGRLPDIDLSDVNRLLLDIQTAHLQHCVGVDLDPDQRREARAKRVREVLL